jgi:hypothetical protein
MDPVSLAGTLTAFLAPLLPYLLKGGEKAAEEVGKKFGGVVWDKATALWARLRPKLEARPGARQMLQEVAKNFDNADARAALRFQLKNFLAENSDLAREISQMIDEAQRSGVIAIASGAHSRAAGRDIIEIKIGSKD